MHFLLLFFAVVSGVLVFFLYKKPDINRLNFVHRFLTRQAADTLLSYIEKLPEDERTIVPYESVIAQLSFAEKIFADKLFSLDPKEFGFNGPKFPIGHPEELVKIDSVSIEYGDGEIDTGVQHVPAHVFSDIEQMNEQMLKDLGVKVLINSGYRSPGRQAYLVFRQLSGESNYSLKEGGKWLAMPGYSEHGTPLNTAVDFITEKGISGFEVDQKPEDFEATREYSWLCENAQKFNLHLSYPKDNPHGVAFEPWHWHWDDKNQKD